MHCIAFVGWRPEIKSAMCCEVVFEEGGGEIIAGWALEIIRATHRTPLSHQPLAQHCPANPSPHPNPPTNPILDTPPHPWPIFCKRRLGYIQKIGHGWGEVSGMGLAGRFECGEGLAGQCWASGWWLRGVRWVGHMISGAQSTTISPISVNHDLTTH
jgi:hypothetical protein